MLFRKNITHWFLPGSSMYLSYTVWALQLLKDSGRLATMQAAVQTFARLSSSRLFVRKPEQTWWGCHMKPPWRDATAGRYIFRSWTLAKELNCLRADVEYSLVSASFYKTFQSMISVAVTFQRFVETTVVHTNLQVKFVKPFTLNIYQHSTFLCST